MTNKELLAPREMTSKELQVLVDEYVANGGKITQCAPGVALNFRSSILSQADEGRQKIKVYKKPGRRGKRK